MKTIIIIISSFKESEKVISLKEELITYFGSRLIEDELKGCPVLLLNRTIEEVDRKYLSALISSYNSDNLSAFIIEKADSEDLSGKFVFDLTFTSSNKEVGTL